MIDEPQPSNAVNRGLRRFVTRDGRTPHGSGEPPLSRAAPHAGASPRLRAPRRGHDPAIARAKSRPVITPMTR